jgi:hypothetical protein
MDKLTLIKSITESVNIKMELKELENIAKRKGIYLELYFSKGHILVGYIKRERQTPKGIGAEVLNDIKVFAQSKGLPVGLDVDLGDLDRSVQDRLINYYTNHGFKFNSAEYKRDPDLDVFVTSGRERSPMMTWNPSR